MKKFTFILLLFLLSCESINGGKTGEKEELIGNILITRLIWIMQLPKFIYSIEYSGSSEKKCENYYFYQYLVNPVPINCERSLFADYE